jgi:DNA transformation protein
MNNRGYVDYVVDILSSFEHTKFRKMFGGYGIYKDEIFYGIISDGILYFKVDDSNRSMYESYGSKPLSFETKNKKQIVMSYWEVPADILENRNNLTIWVQQAFDVAKKTKKVKRAKLKKV